MPNACSIVTSEPECSSCGNPTTVKFFASDRIGSRPVYWCDTCGDVEDFVNQVA